MAHNNSAPLDSWSKRGKVPPANGASKAFAGADVFIGGTPKTQQKYADKGKVQKLRQGGETRPALAQKTT